MHIQTKETHICALPAHLQVIFHLSQCFHFVLNMASLQQTVAAHIHPLICTVVAEYLCVRRAPSLGEVAQWIHQQMGAICRSFQMGLEVFGTQRHLTLQAGLDSQCWLPFLCLRGAAVTQYFTMLLLALGTDKANFALTQSAPGLTDAGGAKAVTAGQREGLAEDVSAHGARQLFLQGPHLKWKKGP